MIDTLMRYLPRQLEIGFSGLAFIVSASFFAAGAGTAEPGSAVIAAPVMMTAAVSAESRLIADQSILSNDDVTWHDHTSNASERAARDPELECVAKVVHHEASNQPRLGQLAVAQIIVNRAHSGRFPSTPCDVANQPGQFFNLTSYNPRRDTHQWQTALEVSAQALDGGRDVTGGAYFYHAASQAPNRFFQSRRRVLTLGDHVFYR